MKFLLKLTFITLSSVIVISNPMVNFIIGIENVRSEPVVDVDLNSGVGKFVKSIVWENIAAKCKELGYYTPEEKNKFWAYRAITNPKDKFASSLENLVKCITDAFDPAGTVAAQYNTDKCSKYDTVVDGFLNKITEISYKNQAFVKPLWEEVKDDFNSEIAGLVNGWMVYDTIHECFYNERFKSLISKNDGISADKDFNDLFDIIMNRMRRKLLESKIDCYQLGCWDDIGFNLIKKYLRHDWDVYLRQFFVIMPGYPEKVKTGKPTTDIVPSVLSRVEKIDTAINDTIEANLTIDDDSSNDSVDDPDKTKVSINDAFNNSLIDRRSEQIADILKQINSNEFRNIIKIYNKHMPDKQKHLACYWKKDTDVIDWYSFIENGEIKGNALKNIVSFADEYFSVFKDHFKSFINSCDTIDFFEKYMTVCELEYNLLAKKLDYFKFLKPRFTIVQKGRATCLPNCWIEFPAMTIVKDYLGISRENEDYHYYHNWVINELDFYAKFYTTLAEYVDAKYVDNVDDDNVSNNRLFDKDYGGNIVLKFLYMYYHINIDKFTTGKNDIGKIIKKMVELSDYVNGDWIFRRDGEYSELACSMLALLLTSGKTKIPTSEDGHELMSGFANECRILSHRLSTTLGSNINIMTIPMFFPLLVQEIFDLLPPCSVSDYCDIFDIVMQLLHVCEFDTALNSFLKPEVQNKLKSSIMRAPLLENRILARIYCYKIASVVKKIKVKNPDEFFSDDLFIKDVTPLKEKLDEITMNLEGIEIAK